jgi:uncharacterized RDD family membrane protein YckC
MALAVDLTVMAIVSQVLAGLFQLTQGLANQVGLAAFGVYYVVAHRYWGMTLGKRLMRLRIQGTTRAVSLMGLVIRFLVEFWGPITAAVMLNLQLGAATDLEAFKTYLVDVVGLREVPILDFASQAVLKTVLIPNLVLALLWLAGFAFALFDDHRQALHDRAARTRIIYEMRPLPESG